jgi:hypothetical protein
MEQYQLQQLLLDEKGQATENTYEYKKYKIVNEIGDVLEIGRYTEETITVEEILKKTGIVFGLSRWI